eukprot:GAHX01002878.1.p1 GENE.GAHX01002878.1~~GAHX01002878.1.p1  ORF type:complete len:336 (-),score=65.46 GAHX01002878.1:290-1297(-)
MSKYSKGNLRTSRNKPTKSCHAGYFFLLAVVIAVGVLVWVLHSKNKNQNVQTSGTQADTTKQKTTGNNQGKTKGDENKGDKTKKKDGSGEGKKDSGKDAGVGKKKDDDDGKVISVDEGKDEAKKDEINAKQYYFLDIDGDVIENNSDFFDEKGIVTFIYLLPSKYYDNKEVKESFRELDEYTHELDKYVTEVKSIDKAQLYKEPTLNTFLYFWTPYLYALHASIELYNRMSVIVEDNTDFYELYKTVTNYLLRHSYRQLFDGKTTLCARFIKNFEINIKSLLNNSKFVELQVDLRKKYKESIDYLIKIDNTKIASGNVMGYLESTKKHIMKLFWC